MKIGFIIPTYSGEKRVALLPQHIDNFENGIVIEYGFGSNLDISDEEYEKKNCQLDSRASIFANCEVVFCLKLLQVEDYEFLRKNQMIIGWTHPTGSGSDFFQQVAIPKSLKIVDLDNIYPTIYYKDKKIPIPFIPTNFIWKNSFYAGWASVEHALMTMGMIPNSSTKVAVLASGSVSQGAYNAMAKYHVDMRMFYRKTMQEFYDTLSDYDIIINGIEVDGTVKHILSKEDLKKLKKGCLIIDSAADAGNAIEGTHYTTIADPIYKENDLYFYEVNNAPSIYYRQTSWEISRSFSKWVYKKDVKQLMNLLTL